MNHRESMLCMEKTHLRDEILGCESPQQLKEKIFPLMLTQQQQWAQKINGMLEEGGYTKTGFAKACKTSRVTVDKWCKGAIPKNRETFLRIGMAADYNAEELNRLLQKYGRYPALYSKSLEDCVCTFVIHHYAENRTEKYDYILDNIKENLVREEEEEEGNITTGVLDEMLNQVADERELEEFILENIDTFSFAYHKLYAYIKVFMGEVERTWTLSVHEMAEAQEWSSSLRQCVSAIRQRKWYPTRNKIISLGLHLNMDLEQVDRMLDLAHMEPLCPENVLESVMIYIFENAKRRGMTNVLSKEYDPDGVCNYAREVLEELDLPEGAEFITELPEADYEG